MSTTQIDHIQYQPESPDIPLNAISFHDGILEVAAQVSVTLGEDSLAALVFVAGDVLDQRTSALHLAKKLARAGKLPGYDPAIHDLVVPWTPFAGNTNIRQKDKGVHITIQQKNVPPLATAFHGMPLRISFDTNSVKYFPGQPANDEACGIIAYVAAIPDVTTKETAQWYRSQWGNTSSKFSTHVSLAGIAPKGTRKLSDLKKLRAEWIHPYPTNDKGYFVDFPAPLDKLVLNQVETTEPALKKNKTGTTP